MFPSPYHSRCAQGWDWGFLKIFYKLETLLQKATERLQCCQNFKL